MSGPRWQRRKEDRPAEIITAAMAVFAEKGFAAARTEDIARRAGISKGAIFLYFPTKEDLFRAVVQETVVPNVDALRAHFEQLDIPFADLLRIMLPRLGAMAVQLRLGAVVKMVLGESGNFPELARVWYDNVVLPAIGTLSGLIARAQARGEVKPGDPRSYAFSIIGPILVGTLWTETFTPIGGDALDLPAIAGQHVETVLGGMAITGEPK